MGRAQAIIGSAASLLKLSNPKMLVEGVKRIEELVRAQQKEIEHLNSKIASSNMSAIMANSEQVDCVTVVTGVVKGVSPDVLRGMCEDAKSTKPELVAVIAAVNEGKLNFAAGCGKEAVARGVHAGKLVKAVAQIAGGNGGGKPELAMAGAKDENKIQEALGIVKETVKNMLK